MDVNLTESPSLKTSPSKPLKAHEISTHTIKQTPWSYVNLELYSDPPSKIFLDNLTVRAYLSAAFTQFLGLHGSAISVDILKVDGEECWIRVPHDDLSAVVASVGGWIGSMTTDIRVGWRVRASGNWLGSLVGRRSTRKIWSG